MDEKNHENKEKHIVKQEYSITKNERRKQNTHSSLILWFTGFSGSGKSTLAQNIQNKLFERNIKTYVLDGDNVRHGLNKDLGFSQGDREENIRRIGEVSKLFIDAGLVVITAFISPYRRDRMMVRNLVEPGEFVEIYVKCPIEVCENRDVKGLYKKARDGVIKGFTGIDDPYEEPENPEITVDTNKEDIEESTNKIIKYLEEKELI